jgi:hypothetical protein
LPDLLASLFSAGTPPFTEWFKLAGTLPIELPYSLVLSLLRREY